MNFLRLLLQETFNKVQDLYQRIYDRYRYGSSGSGVSLSAAGVREMLNQNQKIVIAICGAILLIAIGYALFSGGLSGSGSLSGPSVPSKAWYTDDDGTTLFADRPDLDTPFPRNGKQAVRAMVFSCDGGNTRFVGYLQRDSEKSRETLARLQSQSGSKPNPMALALARSTGFEVKKPNASDKEWVGLEKPADYTKTQQVRCPDGSTNNLAPVFP